MRRLVAALSILAVFATGCTGDDPERGAEPSTEKTSPSPIGDDSDQIEIYSTVIRRLVTEDHTFGRGTSPFKQVYVVNGAIPGAGKPRGNHFGPAPQPFPSPVVDGIQQELSDLPPVEFVIEADRFRQGRQGTGGVQNDGVIISLGPIERKEGEVHVGNGLWCGGLCGQWLTYVLKERGGRWRITGTTGPAAIS